MTGMGKGVREVLRDRSFVIAALVLLTAAVGLQATVRYMQIHFRKDRVELRRSLMAFDTDKVRPYVALTKARMTEQMEEALGTKDYLQMQFDDPTVPETAGGRAFNFFVTYYTGDPDQVPHVPEVCYLGGGYTPAGAYDTEITIPGLGQKDDRIPVRELFFKNTSQLIPTYQTVIYFFSVDGQYVASRRLVQIYQAKNLWCRYAYFSKVELSFISTDEPDRAAALAVAQRFFRKAVPVLVREHWADWDALVKQGRQVKD